MNNEQNNYSQQIVKPKKNNKSFIIVSIIIVIGIIAGFLIFNNQFKKDNTDNNIGNSGNLDNGDSSVSKQSILVATLGQDDHVKSALTSAISKLYGNYKTVDEINMATEVKKNGVIYNASSVEYESQTKQYVHYNLPEHKDYVKMIISGAIKLDGAILVVSAPDVLLHQTREQLYLLQQSGVSRVVVYISESDMVDEDLLYLLKGEIKDLLTEYGFDRNNTPIINGLALKSIEGDKNSETSIKELISSMDKWIIKRTDSETLSSHNKFKAHIYILSKDEGGSYMPFYNNSTSHFLISSSKINSNIILSEDSEFLMPGDNSDVTIILEKNVSLKKGDNFQISKDGKVIAVGSISSIIE